MSWRVIKNFSPCISSWGISQVDCKDNTVNTKDSNNYHDFVQLSFW